MRFPTLALLLLFAAPLTGSTPLPEPEPSDKKSCSKTHPEDPQKKSRKPRATTLDDCVCSAPISRRPISRRAGPPSGSVLTQTVDNSTLESADLVKRSVTCNSCSMDDWVSFGDSDPHVSVKMRRSSLVRPICFDLHGVPNDFFVLYTVPVYNWATSESSLLSLTGHLARSRRPGRNQTFFGMFQLVVEDLTIQVRPQNVTVQLDEMTKVIQWPPRVVLRKFKSFVDSDRDITIIHYKRKVMKISTPAGDFYIKRNLLRYRLEKDAPKENFYYLGIYLKEKDAEFGGIIGEFMHQNASLVSLNGHHKITLMGTEASPFNKTVHVIEHREKDWMNENHFTCWLIPHLAEALQRPMSAYRGHLDLDHSLWKPVAVEDPDLSLQKPVARA
jgi:hypothetical protein